MVEWSLNPLVAIGIALGVMFFGYFFGLAEGNNKGYKKRQKEEGEERILTPPVDPLPPASPPAPSDEIPVLGVSMAPNGGLRLKMDGQGVDTSALDAEQRRRLVSILTQIRPWLEAPKSPPLTQPQPAASPQVAKSPQKVSTSRKAAPSPSKEATETASSAADERPTAPPPPKDEEEHPPAAQSIVSQIDAVLQARLAGTLLEDKGIRLQESIGGGVIVWVGLDKYEVIDDIPDEQIKAAMRAAISEWEDKYTPGL